ncbi:MAG: hypothetical protein Q8N53_23505 [Longimicrobiales bacterium]|nr:hypothetical protein [Longimicrobiales bacterium]
MLLDREALLSCGLRCTVVGLSHFGAITNNGQLTTDYQASFTFLAEREEISFPTAPDFAANVRGARATSAAFLGLSRSSVAQRFKLTKTVAF